jgi:hypothetical protein
MKLPDVAMVPEAKRRDGAFSPFSVTRNETVNGITEIKDGEGLERTGHVGAQNLRPTAFGVKTANLENVTGIFSVSKVIYIILSEGADMCAPHHTQLVA